MAVERESGGPDWFESPLPSMRRWELEVDPENPELSRWFGRGVGVACVTSVSVAVAWFLSVLAAIAF
jgi:hypothetical protein